jgi:hypothetical protein
MHKICFRVVLSSDSAIAPGLSPGASEAEFPGPAAQKAAADANRIATLFSMKCGQLFGE